MREKTILITAILSFLCTTSRGIRCYQCGSEAILIDNDPAHPVSQSKLEQVEDLALQLESCANLESSFSSWGMSVVDCAPEQICMKTIIDDGFDENGKHSYYTSTRGCAMRNTSFGARHPMGCGGLKTDVVPPDELIPNRLNIVCFCEDDYCNGAPASDSISTLLCFLSLIFAKLIF